MPPEIGLFNQDSVKYNAAHRLMSAIGANRDIATTLDDNLTNKDVDGYIERHRVIQLDGSSGVKASSLQQSFDEKLVREVRDQSSLVSGVTSLDKYYQDILGLFGGKDAQNSFAHIGGKMSDTLKALQTNLGQPTYTKEALRELINHAESITKLASKLKDMSREVEGDISASVERINACLLDISSLNVSVKNATEHSSEQLTYEDQRRVTLQALAEQIGIRTNTFNGVQTEVFDKSGNNLIQSGDCATLSYSNSTEGNFLSIKTIDTRTIDISTSILESKQTGQLAGLMQLHDKIIPDLQAQLDEYTRALRDKYNSIHNLGISLDPPTILTGTIGVPGEPNISGSTIISGRGTVRIGTAEPKTGILKSYVDFNLQDNMTIQNLIDRINDANPNLGVTAALTDDGRLQLQSSNPENGIIIGSVGDQPASISASSSYNPSIATNPSHFFGLNNLFETGKQNFGGSSNDISSQISVRRDIVESGGRRIACGALAKTGTIGKKVLNTGDTSTISLLANAYNDPKTSFQTGKSSSIQTNLKMFAIDIINSQKRDAEQTANKLKSEKFVYVGLAKKSGEKGKVNEKKVLLELLETNRSIDILSKAMSINYKMIDSIFKII
jgi:flagellar hook-associated protein FlgK